MLCLGSCSWIWVYFNLFFVFKSIQTNYNKRTWTIGYNRIKSFLIGFGFGSILLFLRFSCNNHLIFAVLADPVGLVCKTSLELWFWVFFLFIVKFGVFMVVDFLLIFCMFIEGKTLMVFWLHRPVGCRVYFFWIDKPEMPEGFLYGKSLVSGGEEPPDKILDKFALLAPSFPLKLKPPIANIINGGKYFFSLKRSIPSNHFVESDASCPNIYSFIITHS